MQVHKKHLSNLCSLRAIRNPGSTCTHESKLQYACTNLRASTSLGNRIQLLEREKHTLRAEGKNSCAFDWKSFAVGCISQEAFRLPIKIHARRCTCSKLAEFKLSISASCHWISGVLCRREGEYASCIVIRKLDQRGPRKRCKGNWRCNAERGATEPLHQ